jgi:hypothetical protein
MSRSRTELQCWDVDRLTPFAEISSWCLQKRAVDRLIVAIRPTLDRENRREFDPRIDDSVSRIFGKNVLRTLSARAWPGTQLIDHIGKVHIISFNTSVQQKMMGTQKYLRGWKQSNDPPLPEDICLYRNGDRFPVLVSVTHDDDAWLFDNNPSATFVSLAAIALPEDLIPPPPDFIV